MWLDTNGIKQGVETDAEQDDLNRDESICIHNDA